MVEIKKKIWPKYFEEILSGGKHHDIRIADFEAKVGDILILKNGILKKWDPEIQSYTGREMKRKISHVSGLKVNDGFYNPEEIKKHGFYVFSLEK